MLKKILCFLSLLLLPLLAEAMASKLNVNEAINKVIQKYGIRSEIKLQTYFKKANVSYPPSDIALLAFKKERYVELWAKDFKWHYIHRYYMTAYSGKLGPKLKERDGQIPEGIYKLVNLNPFSTMHLSMMINYPNTFDKLKAKQEGRKNLGGNIFVHGKNLSVGCIALGNQAIDELFVLVKRIGLTHSKIIIAPNDLRVAKPATSPVSQPKWINELYKNISIALSSFQTKNSIT